MNEAHHIKRIRFGMTRKVIIDVAVRVERLNKGWQMSKSRHHAEEGRDIRMRDTFPVIELSGQLLGICSQHQSQQKHCYLD